MTENTIPVPAPAATPEEGPRSRLRGDDDGPASASPSVRGLDGRLRPANWADGVAETYRSIADAAEAAGDERKAEANRLEARKYDGFAERAELALAAVASVKASAEELAEAQRADEDAQGRSAASRRNARRKSHHRARRAREAAPALRSGVVSFVDAERLLGMRTELLAVFGVELVVLHQATGTMWMRAADPLSPEQWDAFTAAVAPFVPEDEPLRFLEIDAGDVFDSEVVVVNAAGRRDADRIGFVADRLVDEFRFAGPEDDEDDEDSAEPFAPVTR